MKCPHCQTDLVMTERQGIEIDYCPKCRGVWLDRGELDKIIERSTTQLNAAATAPAQPASSHSTPTQPAQSPSWPNQPYPPQPQGAPWGGQPAGYGGHQGHGGPHHHRKKSFWSELFDD